MANDKDLIYVADKLDRLGLHQEAEVLDEVISKQASPRSSGNLSKKSIELHKSLMEKYESSLESLYKERRKLQLEDANPNDSRWRNVIVDYAHNKNAVLLHKMYFEDCIDTRKKGELTKDSVIIEHYPGNRGDFLKELRANAKSVRNGWTIITYCLETNQVYLDIVDLHDIHPIAFHMPIGALDMWEHAYLVDFGLDKDDYIDWWIDRVNWVTIEKRLTRLLKLQPKENR